MNCPNFKHKNHKDLACCEMCGRLFSSSMLDGAPLPGKKLDTLGPSVRRKPPENQPLGVPTQQNPIAWLFQDRICQDLRDSDRGRTCCNATWDFLLSDQGAIFMDTSSVGTTINNRLIQNRDEALQLTSVLNMGHTKIVSFFISDRVSDMPWKKSLDLGHDFL